MNPRIKCFSITIGGPLAAQRWGYVPVLGLVAIMIVSPVSGAPSQYCEPVVSDSTERWPVEESTFSQENAVRAAHELVEILEDKKYDAVVVAGLECAVHNRSIVIEGYALKSGIEEVLNEYRPVAIERFCRFLREEAIWCH